MSITNKNPAPLPDWAADSNRYRIQVTDVTEYAMFLVDLEGNLLTWNKGVERILGYSEAEWVGQHASIVFTPQDNAREACETELKVAAETGSATDIRWHVRKDRSVLFGSGCTRAIHDSDNALCGFSKIFSDETASKELQDKLTESNAALEQFAYVASHDLQEPLRTITSFAQLLKRRSYQQLDANSREFLDLIVGGAARMTALVHDLLDYAHLTTEEDRPVSLELDQNVEAAISQLKAAIEESKATIVHTPLPQLQVDHGQMVRLFQNLIGNALKYRRPDVTPAVYISAERSGQQWVIRVKDNGMGFDQKHAAEIFLPFRRLHRRDQIEGTGVGLAICRRIVENHGGRIWAESVLGEGSTFCFTLPLEGKPPQKHTPSVIENL